LRLSAGSGAFERIAQRRRSPEKDRSTSRGGHDNETRRTVMPAAATVATDDRRTASEITHDVASRETISTPPGETVRPVHNRSRPEEQGLHAPDERISPRHGAAQLTTCGIEMEPPVAALGRHQLQLHGRFRADSRWHMTCGTARAIPPPVCDTRSLSGGPEASFPARSGASRHLMPGSGANVPLVYLRPPTYQGCRMEEPHAASHRGAFRLVSRRP
jgi:hypothetical protein